MQNDFSEAEAAARQAVSLASTSDNWAALGNCLYVQQRWEEAGRAYREALARDASDAGTWRNLGAAEHALGRLEVAEAVFLRSLAIEPNDPNAGSRLALLLMQRGDVRGAIARAERVVTCAPEAAGGWLVLGIARRLLDDFPKAEGAFRQAISLDPTNFEARHNLVLVVLQLMRVAEGEALARQLVQDFAHEAEAWKVHGLALNSQGRMEESLAALRRSVAMWPHPGSHSQVLAALHYCDDLDAAGLLAEHRAWETRYGAPYAAARPDFAAKHQSAQDAAAHRPLRLGFVGMDFSGGPTRFLALRALECLDKSQCTIVCYADRRWDDEYTHRFRAAAALWRSTQHLSDDALAEQVRADEIDVLFDLAGHVGRRLLVFARRSAALQVTWMGYTGTTGVAAMDCLLADRFHVLPGEEVNYSEAVLRMPHDYICYGPPPRAPEVGPLPALAAGSFTFGCFNNPAKYAPSVLDAWAAILRRVPQSRLLLKYGGLDQPAAASRLREQFGQRGVAGERIWLEGWSDNLKLLGRYQAVDLALDSHPYSGGLTTCEALWMGVPVVTCPGQTFASRHSTSHMMNAGYGQFVASDLAGFVELAVEWASRTSDLALLRREMRERVSQSPLCDGEGFARAMLEVVRNAWDSKVRNADCGVRNGGS